MPTQAQIRAARALLNWTQERLATEADIGVRTVIDYETDRRTPMRASLAAMAQAVERAGVAFTERGVEFTDDGGVRPRARP
jgi:transcriptional regulator with XRE-family HTH domain